MIWRKPIVILVHNIVADEYNYITLPVTKIANYSDSPDFDS